MNKIKNLLLTGMALILMQACGSSAKEADLPVRKSCNLERLYKDMPQNIRTDTPDLAFVNALCAGKADEVAALFREKKLFWDERPAVDAPYGRFEGLDGIRSFAEGFLTKFKATSATFTPVFQTIGGGRIALEGVFKFVVDGAIEEVPFFVITDLRTPSLLEEVRMYTHYSFIPGYLCSVCISDYAGHEGEIDWTKTEVSREEAYSINLVDEFHGGCGMKEQED